MVTIGAFIGSIFSYLLQLFLGRTLSINDFGAFNSLLSLSVIVSVFSAALGTSVVKVVSELKAKERFDTLTCLFRDLTFYLVGVGALVFAVIFLARSYIGGFLNISDLSVLTAFGVLMGVFFLSLLPSSYLQGLLRFKSFALWIASNNFLRFALPALLVLWGGGITGVFFGMSLGALVSYLLALFLLKKNFQKSENYKLTAHYKRILNFVGPVLLVQVSMGLLNNIDVILVKHFFDTESAGLYSGVVTVGKVFLFGVGALSVVMFPQVSEAVYKGENYFAKFRDFLFLQSILVLLGVISFSLFPKLITLVMFGEKYLPAVSYIPKFSVFVGGYVLVNLFVLFFLAIEKMNVFLFQVPAVLGQLLLISFFHNSLGQIISMNILVVGVLLLCMVLYYIANVGIYNHSRVS